MKTKIIKFLKPDSKRVIILLILTIVFLLLLVDLNSKISEIYYLTAEDYAYWVMAELYLKHICLSNNIICEYDKGENQTDMNISNIIKSIDTMSEDYNECNETRWKYEHLLDIKVKNLKHSRTIKLLTIMAPFTLYKWDGIYKEVYNVGCDPDEYSHCFISGKILQKSNIPVMLINLIYWYIISCILVLIYGRMKNLQF